MTIATLRTETIPTEFVDLGLRLHIIILAVAVALLLAGTLLGAVALARTERRDPEGLLMFTFFAGLVTAIVGIIFVVTLIPFRSAYHHIYRVEGRIEAVSNVISEANGDLTRTPIVELSTVDRPIAVDDPRVVSLEGRDVTLTCTVGWHYQAADTYACEIHTITPADEDQDR